jgi:hypothetical protein
MATRRARRKGKSLSADEVARVEQSVLPTITEQAEAESLQDYLARGRRFQHLEIEPLKAQWTAAARRFFLSFGEEGSQEVHDAGAELSLRQVSAPVELVQAEFAVAREQFERDRDADPEVRARIRARVGELLARRNDFH